MKLSQINEDLALYHILSAGLVASGLLDPELARLEKWWKGKSLEEIKRELKTKKAIDKQIYAKYPKGSKIENATVSEIIKMYKNQGIGVETAGEFLQATLKAVPGTDMYVVK